MRKVFLVFGIALVIALGLNRDASAQGTTFTYQGSLSTGGTPASGNHDFEFAMFNGGGVQIGSTLTRLNVPINSGSFAVDLDFGNQFQGADRFLEIRVRVAGGGAFTTLAPRQPINSSPHAIRSLDAAQLGGVAANQYQLANAAVINAATQFNLNGSRILGFSGTSTFLGHFAGSVNTGNFNTFVGNGAGQNNTTGSGNSFFGVGAGNDNTTGGANTFSGASAGSATTTGSENSFYGASSGVLNTTGFGNSFFGQASGFNNTIGEGNSFFGRDAGLNNTAGSRNAFYGVEAGLANTTASFNSFFGNRAGASNTTAESLAFFGNQAGENNTTGTFNSFFGSRAGQMNSTGGSNSFFGTSAGRNTIGSLNSFFGSSAGQDNTTGIRNSFFGALAGSNNTTAIDNSFFGQAAGRLNTTGGNNSFFGSSAGVANTSASDNSFFGAFAGELNTTGGGNAFFGKDSGHSNTIGGSNAFFGARSGSSNTTGFGNTFVGRDAGAANTTASNNSFFGRSAGAVTTGADNAYFGASAGLLNTTGQNNAFFGNNSGLDNVTGSNNSYFGGSATGSGALTNATAIGARAFVSQSNSLILGSINGINGATANTNVGIGNTAPINRLTIGQPETPILNGAVGVFNAGGTFVTVRDTTNDIEGFIGSDSNGVLFGSLTNSIVRIRTNNANRLIFDTSGDATFTGAVSINSFLSVSTLDVGGATPLCRGPLNRLSTCSSSLRYKSNVNPFSPGLELIKLLRPVSFNWRDGGMRDLGLVAEEVAGVEPLLTTTNAKGEVEGVKYDRVGVVLVNAVKEQQAQIAAQAETINRQQQQIDALKALVCASNREAAVCKE